MLTWISNHHYHHNPPTYHLEKPHSFENYITPGIPLLTPGSPNPGTKSGLCLSIPLRKIGKNLATPLLGPYAASIKYTVTHHHARIALKNPEIGRGFHAHVHGGAVGEEAAGDCGVGGEEGEHEAEDMSRAVAAIAPDQVKKVRTMNHDASSGKCSSMECGGSAPVATNK